MASRGSSTISLAEIPTVSQLYKAGDLTEAPSGELLFQPSAAINSKVSLIRTSITDLEVTSIVNAANSSLLGGGGVDGAIHAAAGPDLLDECETLGGCETGSAKVTSAYELPSKYIIHAVGPVYGREKRKQDGLQAELLASCYETSLKLAAAKGGSIAFSCLSTGVYGYPSGEAAEIACKTVRTFLESKEGSRLERVVFCCFLVKDEVQYQKLLPMVFPPTADDLGSSEHEQSKSVEGLAGAGKTKQASITSSATTAHDSDAWVTVDKPSSGEQPDGMVAADDSNLDDPDELSDFANTPPKSLPHQEHVENMLVKDW
ncbi:MAG: hypothetical protein Q9170_004971 [Blastenia crenularia]